MNAQQKTHEAQKIVHKFTLIAAGTGAVPVPSASIAVIAENAAMIALVARSMGVAISAASVVQTYGALGALNALGRNVFIEGARVLAWGTGSVWAAAALSTLGATTAGLQTYILGSLAIAIGQNGGTALCNDLSLQIIEQCKKMYKTFVESSETASPAGASSS